jgi:hypothetical protein
MSDYPYYYAWGPSAMRPLDRKEQLCRLIARGAMNSCCLEFEDEFRTITSRNALRKVKPSLLGEIPFANRSKGCHFD